MSAHRPPVEHPGALGLNNKHVLDGIAKAYAAALRLAEDGHEILGIQTGWRKPVIVVQPSTLCEQFQAATKVRYLNPGDPLRRHVSQKVTDYHGCMVQWRIVQ